MSEFLKTHIDDHVLHVILHRGKSNAMHLEMIQEITNTFVEAEANPAIEGVVLTGHEGFFTSGLDLITLYGYNEEEMEQFWQAFMQMLHQLVAFPKPFVTAISGHSPAGGCVMAIAADARVMAEGEYIIGLNEVPVGIIVPHGIFDLYSFWIGEAQAYRFLLEGKLVSPQEALRIGLVDEVVSLDKIQRSAVRHIKKYTQMEKNAWQRTKLNMRSKLIKSMQADRETTIAEMLTQWWKPSTRAILKTVIDNLTSKKK